MSCLEVILDELYQDSLDETMLHFAKRLQACDNLCFEQMICCFKYMYVSC